MSERSRNIIVGVTALAGLAVGLFLLMLFGYVPAWLESGYEVRVHLANASGLTEGSRVRLSGIDIGRVSSVDLLDSSQRDVEVVTLIRTDIRVPRGVRVQAQSPLLGGNPAMAFDVQHLTSSDMDQVLASDGTAMIKGQALTLVSQFAGELEAAIREPAQEFEKLVQRFDRMSEQWTILGENLNQLVESRSVEQVDAQQTKGNLTTLVARADKRLAELKAVIEGIDRWINDPQLREDVWAAAAGARRLTERGHDSLDRLEKKYVAVADDLAGVIGSMRVLTDKARAGDGTVGKLFHDPSLYDNLNDTVTRLQASLDEVRLLVQKWKAEGVPVQF